MTRHELAERRALISRRAAALRRSATMTRVWQRKRDDRAALTPGGADDDDVETEDLTDVLPDLNL